LTPARLLLLLEDPVWHPLARDRDAKGLSTIFCATMAVSPSELPDAARVRGSPIDHGGYQILAPSSTTALCHAVTSGRGHPQCQTCGREPDSRDWCHVGRGAPGPMPRCSPWPLWTGGEHRPIMADGLEMAACLNGPQILRLGVTAPAGTATARSHPPFPQHLTRITLCRSSNRLPQRAGLEPGWFAPVAPTSIARLFQR
jgi:hypothetical protein